MSDKKSGKLPRIEILILLVFFISFFGWVVNKCSRTKTTLIQENTIQEIKDSLEAIAALEATAENPLIAQDTVAPIQETESPLANTRLYIVIDGLNMRDQPNLKGEVLDRLELFDEVEFLNEVTDSTTVLKLNEFITVNEPWVKVRTRKGKDGWVYGAGVHYHRKKYPGLD